MEIITEMKVDLKCYKIISPDLFIVEKKEEMNYELLSISYSWKVSSTFFQKLA